MVEKGENVIIAPLSWGKRNRDFFSSNIFLWGQNEFAQ